MKNIALGIIGLSITIYTLFIGIDIILFQTSKNELEKQVSRSVKNILETEFHSGEEEQAKQILTEEIKNSVSKRGKVAVEVRAIDLEKGLLSVKVTRSLRLLNGIEKKIVVEKTAIMERMYVSGQEVG